MKLGSGLRRRRPRSRKVERGAPPAGWRPSLPEGSLRLAGIGVGLTLAGFLFGYVISTRLLFPAPAPPRDLVSMPDLAGTSLDDARDRLETLDLSLAPVDSVHHPTRHPGEVFGQNPLPGQLTRPGDTVRVVVSRGPELRAVPDVRRLRGDQALAILEASGFAVEIDSVETELPKGTVVEVDPAPETEVALPAELLISVSQGPMIVEMPLILGVPEEEALARLDSLGLVVGEVQERFRFGAAQGLVIEQEPPAGTMLRRGDEVRLSIGRRRTGRDTATWSPGRNKGLLTP